MPLVKRGASARKVLTVHASTLEEVALHPIASLVPFNYTLALLLAERRKPFSALW